jgi:hypothetical protein
MSIEDLRDIAAQLHKFAEEGGTHRAPTLQETHLLFKTALRAVHELESLERRVAALEGKGAERESHQRASLSQREVWP